METSTTMRPVIPPSEPERSTRRRDRRVPGFRPGGEFSVGVEEELMLLRPDGALSARQPGEVVAAVQEVVGSACAVTSEIFTAQVEFATPVCARAD